MDVSERTRQAMERTLLVVVGLEAFVGRFLFGGLALARPSPLTRPPAPPWWHRLLDHASLFLLYFATVLAVLTLVLDRVEAYRRPPGRTAARVGGYIGGACVAALALAVVGGLFNLSGPSWILPGALGGVALYALAAPWLAGHERVTAIGLGAVALPILAYAVLTLLADRVWTEEEIWNGEARLGFARAMVMLASMTALAMPIFLAPRPLARALVQIAPYAAATGMSALGMFMLRANYPTALDAIERTFGIGLANRGVVTGVALGPIKLAWAHLGLLALSAMVWTIVSCLTSASPARRRIGIGLGLVVASGLGFPWPMHHAVVAVGLLAIVAAAPRVIAEERVGLTAATPSIDDEAWLGFVGAVVTRLRGDGDDASALSVRGEPGQISTVVVGERRGVPVRLTVTRVAGAVVSIDLVCGRESARAPSWTAVALAHGEHPEPPRVEPAFALAEPSFDRRFRCRGDRDGFARATAEVRPALTDELDGWLAGWTGEAVRHRIFPGHGAPIDQVLPLSALAAGQRVDDAMIERVVARLELCATVAVASGVRGEGEA